jgi:hypothetical protein
MFSRNGADCGVHIENARKLRCSAQALLASIPEVADAAGVALAHLICPTGSRSRCADWC